MKTVKVHFNAITDIYKFVELATKYPYEMDMCSGRYIIDAKSIMGIFSLDLLSDIELKIHSEGAEDFISEIAPYIVK